MNHKSGLLIAIIALLTACSPHEKAPPYRETPECHAWRTMMTAPMPPDAHNRLKADCEKSVGHGDHIRPD